MAATKYIHVNGTRYSHTSTRIRFFGLHIRGLTSIKYKDSIEDEEARGASRQPGGVTDGEYHAECTAEMLRSDFDELCATLKAINAGAGRYDVAGEISVGLSASGQPSVTDTIKVYRMKSADLGSQQGPANLKVAVEFSVHGIKLNGVLPFADFEW